MRSSTLVRLTFSVVFSAGVAAPLSLYVAHADEAPAIQVLSATAARAAIGGACNTSCLNVCASTGACNNVNCGGPGGGQAEGTICGGWGGTGTAFTTIFTTSSVQGTLSGTASCNTNHLCRCSGQGGPCTDTGAQQFSGSNQCNQTACGG